MRQRSDLSKDSLEYLDKVQEVLEELREYWPLTLRQLYYQLVSALAIENKIPEYRKLSRILTTARLKGLIPWEAIEDRARSIMYSGGYIDRAAFYFRQTKDFLKGYSRDLLQEDEWDVEIWVEKDALSRIVYDAASEYCVDVIVARGFSSVSYVNDCRERVEFATERRGKEGLKILYFGDLDPSGREMLPAMLDTLQNEMGLGGDVEGILCALTPEQVTEFDLPTNPDALKWEDSRAAKYVEEFGELAVELDALKPDDLQGIVRASIEENIDIDKYEEQKELEVKDNEEIEKVRVKVKKEIRKNMKI